MQLEFLAPIGSLIALIFASYLARKVLKTSEGNALMASISMKIRRGANAYLKRQYTGVAHWLDGGHR